MTAPNSPADLDLIERFIAAHNAIGQELQRLLGADEHTSFRSLVDSYAHRHRWWHDADQLRAYTNLRNVMVHDKTVAYTYICVPAASAVTEIEAIRDRLANPARAIPTFERQVVTIPATDSLADAFALIDRHQYSRLPVYDGNRFIGLLSETGITRWLAHRVAAGEPVDLTVPVRDILPRDDRRPRFQFVKPEVPVDEIAYRFHDNTFLEAVLITAHGDATERLLGIVTRGDVVAYWS